MARKVQIDITNLETVGSHGENASLSSAVTLTAPAGATRILLQALTQNIRYRLDGTNPTTSVGFQLAAGDSVILPVPGGTVRIIEETASADVEYQWLA